MGWASGSYLAAEVWGIVREHIDKKHRKECAGQIYRLFCEHDADDWSDDDQLVIDAGIKYD